MKKGKITLCKVLIIAIILLINKTTFAQTTIDTSKLASMVFTVHKNANPPLSVLTFTYIEIDLDDVSIIDINNNIIPVTIEKLASRPNPMNLTYTVGKANNFSSIQSGTYYLKGKLNQKEILYKINIIN